MTRRLNLSRFDAFAHPPSPNDADWFGDAEASVAFLKEITTSEEVVIHAIGPAMLITGVLAPLQQVTPADQNDLLRFFVQSDDTWCV